MPAHATNLLEALNVPDLNFVIRGADSHVVPLLYPRERCDVRLLALRLHKLLDGAVRRIPKVDRVAEGHTQNVARIPIEKVQIIVVQKLGRVKNSLWGLGDMPGIALRKQAGVTVLGVKHTKGVLVVLSWPGSFALKSQNLVARIPGEQVGGELLLVLLLRRRGIHARILILAAPRQLEM
eukprot:5054275-Pleurochrysis_carterae.AAC.2